eukprot:UN22430
MAKLKDFNGTVVNIHFNLIQNLFKHSKMINSTFANKRRKK